MVIDSTPSFQVIGNLGLVFSVQNFNLGRNKAFSNARDLGRTYHGEFALCCWLTGGRMLALYTNADKPKPYDYRRIGPNVISIYRHGIGRFRLYFKQTRSMLDTMVAHVQVVCLCGSYKYKY